MLSEVSLFFPVINKFCNWNEINEIDTTLFLFCLSNVKPFFSYQMFVSVFLFKKRISISSVRVNFRNNFNRKIP